jgi:hypothetical protein
VTAAAAMGVVSSPMKNSTLVTPFDALPVLLPRALTTRRVAVPAGKVAPEVGQDQFTTGAFGSSIGFTRMVTVCEAALPS